MHPSGTQREGRPPPAANRAAAGRWLPACLGLVLVAGCDASTRTSVAPSPTEKCGLTLGASATSFGDAGGEGTLAIATARDCTWTAASAVPWITLPASASGQGSATLRFVVAANGDPAPRTGALGAGGEQITIGQQGRVCAFELSSRDESVPVQGGTRDVDVRASSAACEWTARSRADWIAIQSGASGRGSGRVTFAASPSNGPPRTGSIEIAGHAVTVRQGDGCEFVVTPAGLSVPAAGGTHTVTIATAVGCAWTVDGGAEWAGAVSAESGAGPATVQISVSANAGPARTSSLVVAGKTVSISQASGCAYTASPSTASIPGGGGSASISIATAPGCPWSASGAAAWLSAAPASGSGAATLVLSAPANTGPARSTTLTVAGRSIDVSQASGCTYAVSPLDVMKFAPGGPADLTVSTSPGCPWTAASQAAWIGITSGAAGTGPGIVRLSVERNDGPSRTGTVSVASQTVTVTQANGCRYELSESGINLSALGGTGTFTVTTENGCRWKTVIEGGDGWVLLLRGDSGNGTGPVIFVVAFNPGPARSARLVIENQPFTIRQSGS